MKEKRKEKRDRQKNERKNRIDWTQPDEKILERYKVAFPGQSDEKLL